MSDLPEVTRERAKGGPGTRAQTAGRGTHPALHPLGFQVPLGRRARRGGRSYRRTGLPEALAHLRQVSGSRPGQRPACMWLPAAASLSPGTRSSASRPSWRPGSWPSAEPGPRPRPTELADSAGSGRSQGRKMAAFSPFLSGIRASQPGFKEEGVCLINSKAVRPAPEAQGARLLAAGRARRAASRLSRLISSAR